MRQAGDIEGPCLSRKPWRPSTGPEPSRSPGRLRAGGRCTGPEDRGHRPGPRAPEPQVPVLARRQVGSTARSSGNMARRMTPKGWRRGRTTGAAPPRNPRVHGTVPSGGLVVEHLVPRGDHPDPGIGVETVDDDRGGTRKPGVVVSRTREGRRGPRRCPGCECPRARARRHCGGASPWILGQAPGDLGGVVGGGVVHDHQLHLGTLLGEDRLRGPLHRSARSWVGMTHAQEMAGTSDPSRRGAGGGAPVHPIVEQPPHGCS